MKKTRTDKKTTNKGGQVNKLYQKVKQEYDQKVAQGEKDPYVWVTQAELATLIIEGVKKKWPQYKFAKKSRVLLVGSSAEYGNIEEGESPISELHPLNPTSIYGLTKIFQTHLMRLYVELHGLDIVMARVFNLNGKGISDKLFIGSLYKQIKDFKSNKIK